MTEQSTANIERFKGVFDHMTEQEREKSLLKIRRDSERKTAEYIAKVDKNGDGKISFEELYLNYLKENGIEQNI